MYFRQIQDAASQALTYLLADDESLQAVVIDPLSTQATLILALLAERGLQLRYVLRTHVHQSSRAEYGSLCPATGATLVLGADSPAQISAERAVDGQLIRFGGQAVRVIATPGHSAGSVCYLWHDRLFSGDTLLIGGCDCLSADADPGGLFDSVRSKLFSLPDETLIYPGHYAGGRTVSSIGEERQANPAFTAPSRQAFVAAAKARSAALRKPHLLSHRQGCW